MIFPIDENVVISQTKEKVAGYGFPVRDIVFDKKQLYGSLMSCFKFFLLVDTRLVESGIDRNNLSLQDLDRCMQEEKMPIDGSGLAIIALYIINDTFPGNASLYYDENNEGYILFDQVPHCFLNPDTSISFETALQQANAAMDAAVAKTHAGTPLTAKQFDISSVVRADVKFNKLSKTKKLKEANNG